MEWKTRTWSEYYWKPLFIFVCGVLFIQIFEEIIESISNDVENNICVEVIDYLVNEGVTIPSHGTG